MKNWGPIVFTILDTLIKVLLPVVAGYAINFFSKKLGREKFLLARDVVTSIVASLEQQYRSGGIAKDDRFALAMELAMKRTGLTEEHVAHLIEDAVFQMNVEMRKYDHGKSTTSFSVEGPSTSVEAPEEPAATPVNAGEEVGVRDKLVVPSQTV